MPFPSPMQHLAQRVRVQTNGTHARARLTLPNGRTLQCIVRCDTPEALGAELDSLCGNALGAYDADEGDVELAGFLKKLKKAAKKVGKVALKPVQLAHKYTHQVGPIAKMEKAVQKLVKKNLPIAAPFINIHNSLAKPVHKAIASGSVKKAVTAKAIAQVTKDLPKNVKPMAQAALVANAKRDEALVNIGKAAARAKVLAAAKKAAKKGDTSAKKVVAAAAAARKGTFRVITPSGRTVNVPASKVVH